MTGHAGLGDIAQRHRGAGVGVGKYLMISVAVVAGRRYNQPPFEKPFSVNALRVIGQNVVFGNVVYSSDGRSLLVAFSAQHRDIHLIGAGLRVGFGKNVMVTVTLPAGGGIGSVSFESPAMNAVHEGFLRVIMAHSAGDLVQLFGMGEIFHIGILVAVHAFQPLMHGIIEPARIHIHGCRSALYFSLQIRIGVALKAKLIICRECGKVKSATYNEKYDKNSKIFHCSS